MGKPETKPQEAALDQKGRQRSVIFYILILFIAAFLLLLLTLVMERRANAESMSNLNQSLTGLRESVSAMHSAQDLYESNQQLQDQITQLEQQLQTAQGEKQELQRSLEQQTARAESGEEERDRLVRAMDLFWQIDEAYVRGRKQLCMELIEKLEAGQLSSALPRESTTENDRYSPLERYHEIHSALYPQ